MTPGGEGFIWYFKVNLPGVPFPIPVPVARMDREPSGDEELLFESTEDNELGLPSYFIDVPEARRHLRSAYRAVKRLVDLGTLHP